MGVLYPVFLYFQSLGEGIAMRAVCGFSEAFISYVLVAYKGNLGVDLMLVPRILHDLVPRISRRRCEVGNKSKCESNSACDPCCLRMSV